MSVAPPALDDSIQAQARQIFAHLKARLRDLQRRQREIERQTAAMETRRAELARAAEATADPIADTKSDKAGRGGERVASERTQHERAGCVGTSHETLRRAAGDAWRESPANAIDVASFTGAASGFSAVAENGIPERSRASRLAQPRPRRPHASSGPDFVPVAEPESAGSKDSREREAELRRREEELATIGQRLRDREASLDREREALQQLKSEVADRHQETLEMRLACEQLWSQLASRMEAPLLVESLAKLRRRLADQYHNAAVEMAQRRDEAREWVARLDERQRDLRRQRDEIQTWIFRRHEELEVERLKLLRREQELDARERAQQSQQAEMQRQLAEYQRQIRQLTAQLRCKSELDRLAR